MPNVFSSQTHRAPEVYQILFYLDGQRQGHVSLLNTLSLRNGEQINQNRQILAKERKIQNVQKFSVLL